MKRILFLSFLFLASGFIQAEGQMKIASPEFQNNANIPARFTCQGEDLSPLVHISDVPAGAKSLALIVDDPDAPMGVWIHWVVFNIDPAITVIKEGDVPGTQGWNDFSRLDWGGPCPPKGVHRYFFKLYALDSMLGLKQGATKADVEKAMEGHILQKAELIGLYKKF